MYQQTMHSESKENMKKIIPILLFALCTLTGLLSIAILYIMQPYTILDHVKTKVICNKNNASYEIGPNLIYIFDDKVDTLTDKNLRKLCEYAIINDYNDSFKTPPIVNYHIVPAYEKQGSWGDALLISIVFFITALSFIAIMANRVKKKSINKIIVLCAILTSGIIFIAFFQNPLHKIYCKRQLASRMGNFKKSAYGYGLLRIQQEEPFMTPILKSVYQKCVGTVK